MIELQEVLDIHQALISKFGGSQGVRDMNLLQSALERPFGGLGEVEFYPTPEEKAGAILESIVKNHPFIDGNKRTGYLLMRLILKQFKKDIQATQAEKYHFVMLIASGKLNFAKIVDWIKTKIISSN